MRIGPMDSIGINRMDDIDGMPSCGERPGQTVYEHAVATEMKRRKERRHEAKPERCH